ncbi:MAG: carbamoyl phosphate synthase large subunit, partial [Proteobacteria bacterium]
MNNILITSAGRRVSLVRFFKTELTAIFPDAKVFTTDLHPDFAAACAVSDGAFAVPRVTDETYIAQLLEIARENGVKLIIPTIDTELLTLSKSIDTFREHGIEIVVSAPDLVTVFRDKRQTHDFFKARSIGHAREYDRN